MSRKLWFLIFACVLCLGLAVPRAMAQDTTARGSLSGLVVDSTDASVPEAKVTLTGPTGTRTAMTNDQGNFSFAPLTPGSYSVRVEKAGFRTAELKQIAVLVDKTSSVRVALEVGNVTEVVEVAASAVSVDTSSSQVSSNIDESLYQNIPLGRDISATFYLAPGAVSGLGTGNMNPSISGATGLENQYVADGVSINDPAFGGLGVFTQVYGALGSGINMSFVEELQVKTAGFEPQYGSVTGGVVQIVTKSGTNQFHGVLGGYFQTTGMGADYKNADDFNPLNLVGKRTPGAYYEGDGELGGPVPLFKKHLFFFGAINPTYDLQHRIPAAGSGLFDATSGKLIRQYNTLDYAGKLTWKINDSHSVESSVFGDPTHTSHTQYGTLAASSTLGYSKLTYGTRSWVTRYNGTLTPTWLVDYSFNWNWNHFTDSPASDVNEIIDQTQTAGLPGQQGQFVAQGKGLLINYDSNTKSHAFDTSKQVHFLGHHTFSLGYAHQAPKYNQTQRESGGTYTVPATNATGGDPGTGVAAGQKSDAQLELQLASNVSGGAGCTLCPLMDVPGYATPQRVVFDQVRGRFDGGITPTHAMYQAAYINDAWQMSRNITLNLGLRWEDQRLNGNSATAYFGNMWSPRVGITVDPKGDRKSKIYANFARYAYVLPLDMAIRELSNEEDLLNAYWAPASSGGNVTLNSAGTATFQPDAAHLLNNADGGIPLGASTSIVSGGEPFVPGIRMEYNDEFTVGAEHQFRGGVVLSGRYIDRRMKRVVEDEVGQSVEQLTALAYNGGAYSYVIGNPTAAQDIFVNGNEQVFGAVDNTTVAPCAARTSKTGVVPTIGVFSCALYTDEYNPNAINAAALEALGYPSACLDSNLAPTIYNAANMQDTFGKTIGSACFPGTNSQTWSALNPAFDPTKPAGRYNRQYLYSPGNTLFGGEYQPDGKPDTYADPHRTYEAVEIEVNKAFSHNWQLFANWRIARLRGNYEGAFRNDNGQSDPGISSLYDLTVGQMGLLGQQQADGPLNTDRRHVINIVASYSLDRTFLKNLILGVGIHAQSGIPLTTLAAQQIYGNQGEVPLFGRGDLGRSPFTGQVDAHLEYPWKISEKMRLRMGIDLFNIADCRRSIETNTFVDLGFQVPNADLGKPQTFVAPFSARGSVKLTF